MSGETIESAHAAMTDNKLCAEALNAWGNWIETGTIGMSSADAVAGKRQKLLRHLSLDQMKLLIRIRELREKLNK